MESILEKVRKSPYFGPMVDESTDISVKKHLIFYVTYILDSSVKTSYMGIVGIDKSDSASIFSCIKSTLKGWDLDIQRLVGFGSDGCSTMAGIRTGVGVRLKAINPFMSSIHCAAHRANLCVEDAFKDDLCRDLCLEIDKLVNKVAFFFSHSSIRTMQLAALERELDYKELRLQRIQDTRWLSRQGAIAKLCECLEPVLELFKQVKKNRLYDQLRDFKNVYVIHFLGDILSLMNELSCQFQARIVDVTLVGPLCRETIASIQQHYLCSEIDLNSFLLDSRSYPLIPDGGRSKGLLHELRASVKGNMYRDVELIRSLDGSDLEEGLKFQEAFATSLIEGIRKRMEESGVTGILSNMQVLAPINLPSSFKQVKQYGLSEAKELAEFYGMHQEVDGIMVRGIVDSSAFVEEFQRWKILACEEWRGRTFLDMWSIISAHSSWVEKFPNLLQVAFIGMVQCCSTASCERGFSRINLLKSKFRNQLNTDTLDALVRISLEGPNMEDFNFGTAATHWRNAAHYRHIFTGT